MGGVILDLRAKETLSVPKALSVMFNIPVEKAQEIWKDRWREVVTNKVTPKEFLESISKIIKTNKSVQVLFSEWTELSLKNKECVNWKLLEVIKELKKNFKVYVLSDALDISQDDAITKDIKSRFDGYFVSYQEGLYKPDKEAYLNVLRKINLKAEECVFVDDILVNITVANSLGIKSILYINIEQFKNDLKKWCSYV